jgi:hypothetical protein
MLEERFQKADVWDVSLRFRYRLGFTWPLNRYTVEPGAVYIPFSFESFASVGSDTRDPFSDHERITVGIGYVINPRWRLEMRYSREYRRDLPGEMFDANGDILDIRVKTTVRVLDLLKAR